jgi:truncated hemoglobin YjbI
METIPDDETGAGDSLNADDLADWERALLRPESPAGADDDGEEQGSPLAPHTISLLLEGAARELSGISMERAKALDDVNLVKKCGEVAFIRLAESFVSQAYENLTLGPMFAGVEQEEMAQSLNEYFIQRFGGRPYFADRKGTVSLFRRHRHVPIDETTCDVWLRIMGGCLENLVPAAFDAKSARIVMDHMRYTCGALMAYHRDAQAIFQRDIGDLYYGGEDGKGTTAYDAQDIFA